MIRKRLGRFATLLTASAMALMLLGVGGAVAKTPSGWSINVTKLPATVKAGNYAGYDATIRNDGPSNVNNVTFSIVPTDTPNATPALFSGLTPSYPCTTTGQVVCNLGTMAAGTVITLRVAYAVPTTSTGTFDVSFQLKSGSGYVPGNNQSRGDAYENVAKTSLSASANFDGGFSVDGSTTYSTNQSVGRNNKQASTVVSPDAVVPVTIEDGITTGIACTAAKCSNAFGEWTVLHVKDGATFGAPFKVTLLIWGGSVPGSVSASDIVILHTLDNGTTDTISQLCTPSTGTPTNAECITPTKIGNNYQVVVWLFENGGIRGGF